MDTYNPNHVYQLLNGSLLETATNTEYIECNSHFFVGGGAILYTNTNSLQYVIREKADTIRQVRINMCKYASVNMPFRGTAFYCNLIVVNFCMVSH